MKNKDSAMLQVYYDGLCEICSREIGHYKKQKGAEKINFVDIFSPDFNAEELGLDPQAIHKNLHALTADGKVLRGIDTFIAIWSLLPKYHFLAKTVSLPILKIGFEKGYSVFTVIRPYLPRRKEFSCERSPYCDLSKPSE